MQTPATDNLNVVGLDDMPPPSQVKRELPLEPASAGTVQRGREQLTRILDREDARLFVVVGPCSIHAAGDARLFREAAHRDWMEGVHQ